MDTLKVKKKRSKNFIINDYYHYGINNNTPISFDNILSIIIYTDWSDLSCIFSSTFRKLKEYDTLSMVKKRNSQFANWAKKIRETVEYYGNDGWRDWESDEHNKVFENERGPFFCGLSFEMVISQFNIRLNIPTSTTKHFEVAERFSGDGGIIITINNNGYVNSQVLPCLNCCWLSNYNSEEERLWCGGFAPIKVENITILDGCLNYEKYFKALFYFDCMCSGNNMNDNTTNEVTEYDYFIIRNLIFDILKINGFVNKYPSYINHTFHAYINNKTQIVLNL
eukprot:526869_1